MTRPFTTGLVQGLILSFFAIALEDEGLRFWFIVSGALVYSAMRPWVEKRE